MTHTPHTPHAEIWTTDDALSGEVLSNVPQYEGQEAPHLVCFGIGNSEAAGLIANAPELWRRRELDYELKALLERAWPYLRELKVANDESLGAGVFEDPELTNLYTEIKTVLNR